MTQPPPLAQARALFDLSRDEAYLNAAYMGVMPRAAIEAGQIAFASRARPWEVSIEEAFFAAPERARALAAGLFGASADDIALVPAASYGLATAANALRLERGREILVLDAQFPSNVFIWRRLAERDGAVLRTVSRAPGQSWTEALHAAITPRTGLLACPATHWVDGGRVDLVRLRPALHGAGAHLVLDLTQSLGVQPFDAQAADPDFAVAAGYKWLLGPYASGALYVAPRHQGAVPLEENWIVRKGAADFTALTDYSDAYEPGARRFDMGERSAMQTLPALIAALELIAAYGPETIETHLAGLTAALEEAAAPSGLFARVPDRAAHYLALVLPDGAPGDLPARLKAHGVHVSQRGRSLRVSPHIYNDQTDIARFAAALKAAL